jgi:hypothetical protein
MDPTVQGAWVAAVSGFVGVLVGVGGATLVATKGSRNARVATEKTLEATRDATQKALDASRADRLWARRADAYQDAMTAALQRHDRRQQVLDAEVSAEALELKVGQEWYDMLGRLRTFGTPKVVTAFEHSMKVSERLNVHRQDTKEFKGDLHNAMAADDALVRAIRSDLGIEQVDTKPNSH